MAQASAPWQDTSWQRASDQQLLGFEPEAGTPSFRLTGSPPEGRLPLTDRMLREEPSGNLFGLTHNVAMGLPADESTRPAFMILSTQGGVRAADGTPVALGLHTGHWEVGLLVEEAARTLRQSGCLPFAGACTDPCDGRSQGTPGMMDSLPYRNDAAIVMRRIARSLPTRSGVMGIGTCDKGLPAVLLALAGLPDDPVVVVPGGTTLPVEDAEDTGMVQSIGTRYSHGMITVEHAAEMGCKACGSAGGGCQFMGTAASTQVVAEALGLTLPHAALAPSGEPVWLDLATRSAHALLRCAADGLPGRRVLSSAALENAMVVHAAFGGSTNLLLHIPAIAHAAGLAPPTVSDWTRVNSATPRLVDALPNGPRNHPTVDVFAAGGVPEVMLHLRDAGLLNTGATTVTGLTLDAVLDSWRDSRRRRECRHALASAGTDPAAVIMDQDHALAAGLTSTVVFPVGNIAPEGAVIKATAIDPSMVDEHGVYRHRGRVRLFTSEASAIAAIKAGEGRSTEAGVSAAVPITLGEVLVVAGIGPAGTGMEEIYQITSALKYLPWGKMVPVLTDARFSGVSTGACIGHIGPEALAGGPLGRLRDGDTVAIVVDRNELTGTVDLVATEAGDGLTPEGAAELLASRTLHPGIAANAALPGDTKLWAALQSASGGTWAGAVYDPQRIAEVIEAGLRAGAAAAATKGEQ